MKKNVFVSSIAKTLKKFNIKVPDDKNSIEVLNQIANKMPSIYSVSDRPDVLEKAAKVLSANLGSILKIPKSTDIHEISKKIAEECYKGSLKIAKAVQGSYEKNKKFKANLKATKKNLENSFKSAKSHLKKDEIIVHTEMLDLIDQLLTEPGYLLIDKNANEIEQLLNKNSKLVDFFDKAAKIQSREKFINALKASTNYGFIQEKALEIANLLGISQQKFKEIVKSKNPQYLFSREIIKNVDKYRNVAVKNYMQYYETLKNILQNEKLLKKLGGDDTDKENQDREKQRGLILLNAYHDAMVSLLGEIGKIIPKISKSLAKINLPDDQLLKIKKAIDQLPKIDIAEFYHYAHDFGEKKYDLQRSTFLNSLQKTIKSLGSVSNKSSELKLLQKLFQDIYDTIIEFRKQFEEKIHGFLPPEYFEQIVIGSGDVNTIIKSGKRILNEIRSNKTVKDKIFGVSDIVLDTADKVVGSDELENISDLKSKLIKKQKNLGQVLADFDDLKTMISHVIRVKQFKENIKQMFEIQKNFIKKSDINAKTIAEYKNKLLRGVRKLSSKVQLMSFTDLNYKNMSDSFDKYHQANGFCIHFELIDKKELPPGMDGKFQVRFEPKTEKDGITPIVPIRLVNIPKNNAEKQLYSVFIAEEPDYYKKLKNGENFVCFLDRKRLIILSEKQKDLDLKEAKNVGNDLLDTLEVLEIYFEKFVESVQADLDLQELFEDIETKIAIVKSSEKFNTFESNNYDYYKKNHSFKLILSLFITLAERNKSLIHSVPRSPGQIYSSIVQFTKYFVFFFHANKSLVQIFELCVKSIVGKILFVIDSSSLTIPKNAELIKKKMKLRSILGGDDVKINPHIIEIYVYVALAIEFYHGIFFDTTDKNNIFSIKLPSHPSLRRLLYKRLIGKKEKDAKDIQDHIAECNKLYLQNKTTKQILLMIVSEMNKNLICFEDFAKKETYIKKLQSKIEEVLTENFEDNKGVINAFVEYEDKHVALPSSIYKDKNRDDKDQDKERRRIFFHKYEILINIFIDKIENSDAFKFEKNFSIEDFNQSSDERKIILLKELINTAGQKVSHELKTVIARADFVSYPLSLVSNVLQLLQSHYLNIEACSDKYFNNAQIKDDFIDYPEDGIFGRHFAKLMQEKVGDMKEKSLNMMKKAEIIVKHFPQIAKLISDFQNRSKEGTNTQDIIKFLSLENPEINEKILYSLFSSDSIFGSDEIRGIRITNTIEINDPIFDPTKHKNILEFNKPNIRADTFRRAIIYNSGTNKALSLPIIILAEFFTNADVSEIKNLCNINDSLLDKNNNEFESLNNLDEIIDENFISLKIKSSDIAGKLFQILLDKKICKFTVTANEIAFSFIDDNAVTTGIAAEVFNYFKAGKTVEDIKNRFFVLDKGLSLQNNFNRYFYQSDETSKIPISKELKKFLYRNLHENLHKRLNIFSCKYLDKGDSIIDNYCRKHSFTSSSTFLKPYKRVLRNTQPIEKYGSAEFSLLEFFEFVARSLSYRNFCLLIDGAGKDFHRAKVTVQSTDLNYDISLHKTFISVIQVLFNITDTSDPMNIKIGSKLFDLTKYKITDFKSYAADLGVQEILTKTGKTMTFDQDGINLALSLTYFQDEKAIADLSYNPIIAIAESILKEYVNGFNIFNTDTLVKKDMFKEIINETKIIDTKGVFDNFITKVLAGDSGIITTIFEKPRNTMVTGPPKEIYEENINDEINDQNKIWAGIKFYQVALCLSKLKSESRIQVLKYMVNFCGKMFNPTHGFLLSHYLNIDGKKIINNVETSLNGIMYPKYTFSKPLPIEKEKEITEDLNKINQEMIDTGKIEEITPSVFKKPGCRRYTYIYEFLKIKNKVKDLYVELKNSKDKKKQIEIYKNSKLDILSQTQFLLDFDLMLSTDPAAKAKSMLFYYGTKNLQKVTVYNPRVWLNLPSKPSPDNIRDLYFIVKFNTTQKAAIIKQIIEKGGFSKYFSGILKYIEESKDYGINNIRGFVMKNLEIRKNLLAYLNDKKLPKDKETEKYIFEFIQKNNDILGGLNAKDNNMILYIFLFCLFCDKKNYELLLKYKESSEVNNFLTDSVKTLDLIENYYYSFIEDKKPEKAKRKLPPPKPSTVSTLRRQRPTSIPTIINEKISESKNFDDMLYLFNFDIDYVKDVIANSSKDKIVYGQDKNKMKLEVENNPAYIGSNRDAILYLCLNYLGFSSDVIMTIENIMVNDFKNKTYGNWYKSDLIEKINNLKNADDFRTQFGIKIPENTWEKIKVAFSKNGGANTAKVFNHIIEKIDKKSKANKYLKNVFYQWYMKNKYLINNLITGTEKTVLEGSFMYQNQISYSFENHEPSDYLVKAGDFIVPCSEQFYEFFVDSKGMKKIIDPNTAKVLDDIFQEIYKPNGRNKNFDFINNEVKKLPIATRLALRGVVAGEYDLKSFNPTLSSFITEDVKSFLENHSDYWPEELEQFLCLSKPQLDDLDNELDRNPNPKKLKEYMNCEHKNIFEEVWKLIDSYNNLISYNVEPNEIKLDLSSLKTNLTEVIKKTSDFEIKITGHTIESKNILQNYLGFFKTNGGELNKLTTKIHDKFGELFNGSRLKINVAGYLKFVHTDLEFDFRFNFKNLIDDVCPKVFNEGKKYYTFYNKLIDPLLLDTLNNTFTLNQSIYIPKYIFISLKESVLNKNIKTGKRQFVLESWTEIDEYTKANYKRFLPFYKQKFIAVLQKAEYYKDITGKYLTENAKVQNRLETLMIVCNKLIKTINEIEKDLLVSYKALSFYDGFLTDYSGKKLHSIFINIFSNKISNLNSPYPFSETKRNLFNAMIPFIDESEITKNNFPNLFSNIRDYNNLCSEYPEKFSPLNEYDILALYGRVKELMRYNLNCQNKGLILQNKDIKYETIMAANKNKNTSEIYTSINKILEFNVKQESLTENYSLPFLQFNISPISMSFLKNKLAFIYAMALADLTNEKLNAGKKSYDSDLLMRDDVYKIEKGININYLDLSRPFKNNLSIYRFFPTAVYFIRYKILKSQESKGLNYGNILDFISKL